MLEFLSGHLVFLLQSTQRPHFISVHSYHTMLEHETVARLRNEVEGLRAEKAQLEAKCFSQDVQITRNQNNVNEVGETSEHK